MVVATDEVVRLPRGEDARGELFLLPAALPLLVSLLGWWSAMSRASSAAGVGVPRSLRGGLELASCGVCVVFVVVVCVVVVFVIVCALAQPCTCVCHCSFAFHACM